MSQIHREKVRRFKETGMRVGMELFYADSAVMAKAEGLVILDMRDAETGKQLAYWEKKNVITLDGGILAARLFKDSQFPKTGQNNGVTMLAMGTGATGNLLNPDAPQDTQRRINTEIGRKAFSNAQFRNADGVAVAYPTNIVDFTATFGEAEAVGPLNEMAVISAYSANPEIKNPINNGPTDYDPTIDVTFKDLLGNYLTYSVISKPSTAILAITWRFSF